MRTVLMVLFDQVQSLDVTGPLEVFTGANTWRGGRGDGPAYDIRTASLGGRPVRTSSGLRVTPDEDLREVPASPPWPAHRARRRGITPTRPRTDRLAARPRPPGGPPGLGVHGCLPARRGRAARRAAGDHPLGLLRLARRQVPAGQRRGGSDLRPGRERRHLGGRHRWHRPRARPGGRRPGPGRGPGHRQAAGGVPAPPGQPGPVQRPARRAAGQPGAAPRGAAVDRRPSRVRTCRWRRWPARPACPRGSSPGPSRPRWACRPAATSTGSGSRRPGVVWRTPPTGSSRPPDPAATARPRRCAAPSSAPWASARASTAAGSGLAAISN